MNEKLKALREKLAKAQADMKKVFDEAGEDLDFSKVTAVSGTDTEKAAALRKMNDDCATIQKEIEPLLDVEKARRDWEQRNGAVSTILHPSASADSGEGGETKGREKYADLGAEFIKCGAHLKDNRHKTLKLPEGVNLKTLFATSAGWAVPTIRTGRIVEYATRPISVVDILPMGQTTLAAVTYMVESTFTNSAVEIKEGDTDSAGYGESALALTETSSTVRKIATFVPVTDEQLEDVPQVQGYLNNRLGFMLRQRLDYQIINGNGTAPNLKGILNQSSIQTIAQVDNAGDLVTDVLYRAMTLIRAVAFADPSGIVMHPYDWENIRLLKTNDGVYVWGHPSEPGPERIFGQPVSISTAITEKTALVGAFRDHSELVERRGIEIKVSDSHDTYFTMGKQAVRADVRVALCVYRTPAFVDVTLT